MIGSITVVVVLFMAVMVALSMRSGFSQYLAEAEIERFDRLIFVLGKRYDAQNPGWPDITASRATWNRFVREAMPPPPGRRRPAEQGRRPPPRDPLQLGRRLIILDQQENVLIGNPNTIDIASRRPIVSDGPDGAQATVGWLALSVAHDRPGNLDTAFLLRQYQTLAIASVLAIVLSVIAAWFLSRQFLRPLNSLAAGSKVLARGDFSFRMGNNRQDELGDLIDNFNDLAANLEEAKRAEDRWISDTSHELKTPLAVLRSQIEALQDGVRQSGPEIYASLHASTMRLSRLVDDLSTLSQSREGALAATKSDENLVTIVEEAIETFEPLLPDDLVLVCDKGESDEIVVSCDRFRLRQLIDNLLENSRRYTSSPGRILVSLEGKSDGATLTIEDSAPAPSSRQLENLFDRFFREDESRSREKGGSGLGLSICREIAKAHGGKISAELSKIGGLKMVLELPVTGNENA